MSYWIATVGQKKFDFDNPEAFDFNAEEIACALGNIGRYTGNTRLPYSVAQHCTLVASFILKETGNAELAYQGLWHDGAEAFTGDMSSPLKAWLRDYKVEHFRILEKRIEAAMCKALGVKFPFDPIVKEVDIRISLNEKNTFFPTMPDKWQIEQEGYSPLPDLTVIPVPFFVARTEFILMHNKLRARMGL